MPKQNLIEAILRDSLLPLLLTLSGCDLLSFQSFPSIQRSKRFLARLVGGKGVQPKPEIPFGGFLRGGLHVCYSTIVGLPSLSDGSISKPQKGGLTHGVY